MALCRLQLSTTDLSQWRNRCVRLLPVLLLSLLTGCHSLNLEPASTWAKRGGVVMGEGAGVSGEVTPFQVPRELQKITLPSYVIEPPDILLIDAVKVVPKPPYKIEPLDVLQITVDGALPDQPISGLFAVDTGGMVQLGAAYGSVRAAGKSVEEAALAVERHLKAIVAQPKVTLSLAQTAGQQQIVGEHMVGPDGTVNLGTYGSVRVTGLTLEEARQAIEKHLEKDLLEPKIAVDVFAYNSKVYYVITEGGGSGDRLVRFPVTGNETVLDAIANVGGLAQISSKIIWVARPAPGEMDCDQILPVSYKDIARGGSTKTNWQLLPGDRVLIAEDRLVAFDATVNKLTAPFERMFGFILLGTQAVQTMQRFPGGLNNSSGGF